MQGNANVGIDVEHRMKSKYEFEYLVPRNGCILPYQLYRGLSRRARGLLCRGAFYVISIHEAWYLALDASE